MRPSGGLPAGVTAHFGEAARRRRRTEARLVERLEAAGFSEVMLPVLDYLAPYEPLLSSAGRAELYRFSDRDGEQLALRADFTPMLARLVAPRLKALELPQRLFYTGDVVRYQANGPGRQRESYQLGLELLGQPGEQAARELLRLHLRLLADCGLREVKVVLGFAGALDGLLLKAAEGAGGHAAAAAGGPGGATPALVEAVSRRRREAVRGLSPGLLAVVEKGVPDRPEDLGSEAGERLSILLRLRDELEQEAERGELGDGPERVELSVDLAEFAPFTLDPQLRAAHRPRSYYDGLIFRSYAPAPGSGAVPVGGGGRYDRLFRRLGAEVPAVGSFLALDRILAEPSRGRDRR